MKASCKKGSQCSSNMVKHLQGWFGNRLYWPWSGLFWDHETATAILFSLHFQLVGCECLQWIPSPLRGMSHAGEKVMIWTSASWKAPMITSCLAQKQQTNVHDEFTTNPLIRSIQDTIQRKGLVQSFTTAADVQIRRGHLWICDSVAVFSCRYSSLVTVVIFYMMKNNNRCNWLQQRLQLNKIGTDRPYVQVV